MDGFLRRGCNRVGKDASYLVDCARDVKVQPVRLQALDKGEPPERVGRKATGLTLDASRQGSRAAEEAWVFVQRFGGSLSSECYGAMVG